VGSLAANVAGYARLMEADKERARFAPRVTASGYRIGWQAARVSRHRGLGDLPASRSKCVFRSAVLALVNDSAIIPWHRADHSVQRGALSWTVCLIGRRGSSPSPPRSLRVALLFQFDRSAASCAANWSRTGQVASQTKQARIRKKIGLSRLRQSETTRPGVSAQRWIFAGVQLAARRASRSSVVSPSW
jgi:hypothetical protein